MSRFRGEMLAFTGGLPDPLTASIAETRGNRWFQTLFMVALGWRRISRFASRGGFVIRSRSRNTVSLFLGSSAVEHSTVNRMVAGSNPARGAITDFPH